MSNKCMYCNKKIDSLDQYCSNECKEKGERFLAYCNKWKVVFYMMIAVSIVLLLIPAFSNRNDNLVVIGMVGLGVTCFIFPFSTPQGVSMYGMRKSKLVVRVLAIISILLGAYIYTIL